MCMHGSIPAAGGPRALARWLDRDVPASRVDLDLHEAVAAPVSDNLSPPNDRLGIGKAALHIAAARVGAQLEGRVAGKAQADVAGARVRPHALGGAQLGLHVAGARIGVDDAGLNVDEAQSARARVEGESVPAESTHVAGSRAGVTTERALEVGGGHIARARVRQDVA